MPSGKGRGSASAGVVPEFEMLRPTESGSDSALKTEGRMPTTGSGEVTGTGIGSTGMSATDDSLQRALEVEMVDYLRDQNSKLLAEVAHLRGKLDSKSGVASSTSWSAVGGTDCVNGSGVKSGPIDRPGRHGSRTPRNRIREDAVSPKGRNGFIPNGTKVPDGPPPTSAGDEVILPPVPPIPMIENENRDDQMLCSSFVNCTTLANPSRK
eukprot:s226_g32.t1